MSRQTTQADRVREFAQKERVFTRAQLISELGETAAGALGQMTGSEITRHAIGVYSVAGIRSDDSRVKDIIEEVGARRLSEEEKARDAKKAEERSVAAIGSKIKTEDSTVDKVADHFEDHPVASASDLRRLFGKSATTAAKTLADRGVLDKVRDGLWVRSGVDPLGKDMKSYVAEHSQELAAVRREIEEVDEITKTIEEGSPDVEWSISRPSGRRGIQVYLRITGVPVIFAQSRKGKVQWYALKGRVSATAAEHIARMVLDPMPERISELVSLVEDGKAPSTTRRRHGGYREYERPADEVTNKGKGYGVWDTYCLDPRRLGNGLPEEVILEIDDREDDRLVTMLTDVPNLHIIRTHLEMADFVARYDDKTLAIERKTSEDLSASLDDNRLAEQVHRMSDSGIPSCFIIEGGVTGARSQPLPRLVALQTRLNFGVNMRVLETIDLAHTAYIIVTSIRDHFFGTGSAFDLKPIKIPGLGAIERAQFMLQSVPGISPTRSAALIDKFGSIAGIAAATAKEIQTVEGIGKKTAETLHEVFNAK